MLAGFVCGVVNGTAQRFDPSANGSLTGSYFVRQVSYSNIGSNGSNSQARSLSGTIAFDGAGSFAFTGLKMDTATGSTTPASYSVSGTYAVASNHLVQMSGLLDPQLLMSGALGASALVASTPGGPSSDLLIAIPAAVSAVSQGTLQGSYQMASLDFLHGESLLLRDSFFSATADGAGNFTAVTLTGKAVNLGSHVSQITAASYALGPNGSGTATFPIPSGTPVESLLVSGTKTIYVSGDGNLVVGGASDGYDMLVGMKALSGTASNSSLQGLYYLAGIQVNYVPIHSPGGTVDWSSDSGSFTANGAGTSLWHERLHAPGGATYDNTFDSNYMIGPGGTVSELYYQYGVGAGGQAFLLSGNGDNYALTFATRAPTFTGTGTFLNPASVMNAASLAPITNPVAPGESVILLGSGLASSTTAAPGPAYPFQLGGVSVAMNGLPAALKQVSAGRIDAVVPFAVTDNSPYVSIQLNNNGQLSNPVMVYGRATAPGVYTASQAGNGDGSIFHLDSSPVTPANPAHPGETVQVLVTGLGKASPPVDDGVPGPAVPPSNVLSTVTVYMNGQAATISSPVMLGSVPGTDQISVQVPPTAGSGDVYLDVQTTDAYTSQARIFVSPTAASALGIAMTHTGSFTQGQTGAVYTVTVSNQVGAAATSGTVTVTESAPSGLTVTSMSGAGWSCMGSTCMRSDALAAGSSYPAILVAVNVASNASSQVTNRVTVTGGSSVPATANDATTILVLAQSPVLGISATNSGNFTQGLSGGTYSVTVSNQAGAVTTSGTVTVTETVPTGLTLVSMAGTGWNCESNVCTRSDALAGGASYPPITVTVNVAPDATSPQVNQVTVSGGGSAAASATDTTNVVANATPLSFVPITPCRVADTRNAPNGPFAGPSIVGNSSRDFLIPNSACGIPATAAAYALNVSVVPHGSLSYVTIWPAGQAQPVVSTLNSFDGRIKGNAAIVPAGANGAVSVYATDTTDVILDITGYFVAAGTQPTALAFYPLTPCRVADTRNPSGPMGGPFIGGNSSRSFPVQSAPSCNIPATAEAYSLNVTALPRKPSLEYLTAWPTGQTQPFVATLNAVTGTITANAAIVAAGTGGQVSVYATDDADVLLDINGYFAPPGAGGLSLYNLTPCRVFDTRNPAGSPPFAGKKDVNVAGTGCGVPQAAQAYVLNATVVPAGILNFLSLWPQGQTQPLVSTLNAIDATVTSNMAIVPTTNGYISAFATDNTQLVLDISGFFAP